MTASEFAFLALGLVLGVASGSALVMVLGSRPAAREVRVTVEHDAVPRRAATLSSDAFSNSAGEVARGGPADRRLMDRDEPPPDPPAWSPGPGPGIAVRAAVPGPSFRTPVPSRAQVPAARAVPINPERDPSLEVLRIRAALAAEHLHQNRFPTSTAVLEPRPADGPDATAGTAGASAAVDPSPDAGADSATDETPAVIRMLRGDHRALIAAVATLAADDDAERRSWQAALIGLADSLVDRAIAAGWLDFPVGNSFWDTFTIEQCRTIAGALAVSGYRFDRVDGWEDGRVPGYRELTAAVATAGLDPRRIRNWPTQDELARAYANVTVAADDFLAAHAPSMSLESMQALVGIDGTGGLRLWADWDRAQAVLLAPVAGA
jgi:hypothetical protein